MNADEKKILRSVAHAKARPGLKQNGWQSSVLRHEIMQYWAGWIIENTMKKGYLVD